MTRVVIVLLGLALVVALWWKRAPDDSLSTEAEAQRSELEYRAKEAERDLEQAKARAEELRAQAARAEAAHREAQKGLEEAQAEAARLRTENERLATELAAFEAKRKATIEGIIANLKKLKEGSDLQAFLSPSTLSDIVADIKQLGDPGVDALLQMLASDDPIDQRVAAQILMNMDEPRAIDPLADLALQGEDAMVSRWASQALIRMDSKEVVPALENLVANASDEGVRVNSMFGLCKHGNEWGLNQAIDYFKNQENNEEMRRALGRGILVLQKPEVMPFADEVVKTADGDRGALAAAIEYYKAVGGDTAVSRLRALATHADEAVRERAKAALKELE